MSLAGLLLILAAAVCHATWNFYVKQINGGVALLFLISIVSSVVYAPLVLGLMIIEPPAFDMRAVLFIIGSGILHVGYFLLLQAGYRHGDLSLVYPVARTTGPLVSTSFAVIFLGELLTPQIAVGAGTIVFGVLMLTGGFKRRASHLSASLFFGVCTGLLIGSYTAWDAYTVSVLGVHPLALDYFSTFSSLAVIAPLAWGKRSAMAQQWREHRTGVLVIAVISPLAYILVLYAMTFTPVIYVAPMREVSVLLSVLAGSILLNEGGLKHRLGWAVFILAGMTILMLA